MAYGMLTSFALGAAEGLGTALVNKFSKDQEAELKAKADMEREARIEEAAIRLEARKNERSDYEFDRLQSQKTIDAATEREAKFEDERRKLREANDPNTLTGQKTVAEIADIKKRGMLTDTSMAEKEVETEQKQRLNSLQSDLVNAKTPEEKATIASTIQQLSGKQTEENRALSKIVVSPDGKSYLKIDGLYNTATGKEIWAENAVPANPKEVENKAVAYANLKAGTSLAHASEAPTLASKGWGDTGKENARKSEEFSKAYNEFKLNGGVAIESDKTKTSLSPAPFKADDPARQKEYDIIFGGVVKQHESGNKGVNAQNPTSSAGGTWQLTDPTAEFYKAKKDANGKISNAEKDRVAPEFYKDVYRNTNGDPAAMIASGFAPNDVKSAMKDAVKKGTKWWQETDSITPKDMEESYVRARESVARLQSVGIEPDARLLDFVDNYKATKIASATPDKSAFKLKAVRPAL
jgi:hypothetical protein